MPNVLAYTLVAALLVITPGPDTALVTRNALAHGRRGALLTALGIEVGLLVWTIASVAGLAALLAASAMAFTIVKLAGAAYLLYLGVRSLLALRHRSTDAPAYGRRQPQPAARSTFRQGVLSNLLNPKIAVFFTSIIPQFVTPGSGAWLESAVLAGIYVVLGLIWLVAYGLLASTASAFLARPRVKKVLSGVTGLVCVGFGLRLATETA